MTSSNERSWANDWATFVKAVALDFEAGLTADDVSSKYATQPFEWLGVIDQVELPDNVVVLMSEVDFDRAGKKLRLVGSTLVLEAGQKTAISWAGVQVGDAVVFRTSIHLARQSRNQRMVSYKKGVHPS